MKFKKDDVIVCVDSKRCIPGISLTTGKEYVVLSGGLVCGFVVVDDDHGTPTNFGVERFKLKEKKVEKIKWVVGQEVWDVRKGLGVITRLDNDLTYPVQVGFAGGFAVFTIDGKYEESDKHRSLYFSEPAVSAELYPKFVPTLIGKRVVTGSGEFISVRDETEDYVIAACGKRVRKDVVTFYEIGEKLKFD